MRDSDWPNGGAVRNDQDEGIVQGAVEDAEARQVLVDGIETCRIEGDEPSYRHFTALLAEADRRIRVRDEIRDARAHALDSAVRTEVAGGGRFTASTQAEAAVDLSG